MDQYEKFLKGEKCNKLKLNRILLTRGSSYVWRQKVICELQREISMFFD